METTSGIVDPCSPNPCGGNLVECIDIDNEAYCRCPGKNEYYRLEHHHHIECHQNDDNDIAIQSSLSNFDATRTSSNAAQNPIAPSSLLPTTLSLHVVEIVAIVTLTLGILAVAIMMLTSYWKRQNGEHDKQRNPDQVHRKDSSGTSLSALKTSSDPTKNAISSCLSTFLIWKF